MSRPLAAIASVRSRRGTRSRRACAAPFTNDATPGPRVARQAPGRPVSSACAQAISAPAVSVCERTKGKPARPAASMRSRLLPPPGRPTRVRTPDSRRRWTRRSATVGMRQEIEPVHGPNGSASGLLVSAAKLSSANPAATLARDDAVIPLFADKAACIPFCEVRPACNGFLSVPKFSFRLDASDDLHTHSRTIVFRAKRNQALHSAISDFGHAPSPSSAYLWCHTTDCPTR